MTTLNGTSAARALVFIQNFAGSEHGVTDFIRIGTRGDSEVVAGGCYGSMSINPNVGSIVGVGATIRHREGQKNNESFLDFFFGLESPWSDVVVNGEIERVMSPKNDKKTIGFIVKNTDAVGMRALVNFMIASRYCRDYYTYKEHFEFLVANGVNARLALWASATMSNYRTADKKLSFIQPPKRSPSGSAGYFAWTNQAIGVDLNRFFTQNYREELISYHTKTKNSNHGYHPSDSIWWGKGGENQKHKDPFMLSDVINFDPLVNKQNSRYSQTNVVSTENIIQPLLEVQSKLLASTITIEADVIGA